MFDPLPNSKAIHNWKIAYGLFGSPVASAQKTIVFVHGTPWSSQVFRPLVEAITAVYPYQILLYDLAGYGESQTRVDEAAGEADKNGFRGDTSVKAQADVLRILLSELSNEGKISQNPPDVIAHDIAGAIALYAHLVHDCDFASLLLLDTNAVLPWGDGFYKQVRSSPQVFLDMPAHTFEAVICATIKSAICRSEELGLHAWIDTLAKPWLEANQASFVRQIAQANDADVATMLDQSMYEQVRCPVKIMWGDQDTWIPREKMEKLAGLLKHCLKGFVVVPRAGHLLMIDQPERIAIEVVSWLTGSAEA